MNHKFDDLAKSLAQSVTRRAALKKFGLGLAGMALACFGLANKAEAAKPCVTDADCPSGSFCYFTGVCATAGCISVGAPCNQSSDCCSGHCARVRLPFSNSYTRLCIA